MHCPNLPHASEGVAAHHEVVLQTRECAPVSLSARYSIPCSRLRLRRYFLTM
jgi:hypothetical protein